jgi:hypothetical protein
MQSTSATLNCSVCFKRRDFLQWSTFEYSLKSVTRCPNDAATERPPEAPAIPMPGNEVQEAFTDLRAQIRVRITYQAGHAWVVTFCESERNAQRHIVRQRL